MIDPFHLQAYDEIAVNYNRDVEIFPVLNAIFEKIYGQSPYKSPTDMGVNMVGNCIIDDEAVCEASRQEIIRRYYEALCAQRRGTGEADAVYKIELLMNQEHIDIRERAVVAAALGVAKKTDAPAVALQLPDGRIVTGKTKELLGASSAMLLNALKALSGIPDSVQLISAEIIEPVQALKVRYFGNRNPRLHMDEVLIALSICAATDERAARALSCLSMLEDCEAHASVILASVDETIFRRLKVNLTSEPNYETKRLYHR